MIDYNNYLPNFMCSTDDNNYGLINNSIGLITYDEVVYAGGFPLQDNDTYYLNNGKNFWTMGPSGCDSTHTRVWRIYNTGAINTHNVNGVDNINPVINLKSDTVVIGSGTSTSPWVVQ